MYDYIIRRNKENSRKQIVRRITKTTTDKDQRNNTAATKTSKEHKSQAPSPCREKKPLPYVMMS